MSARWSILPVVQIILLAVLTMGVAPLSSASTGPLALEAQEIRGRLVDAENGVPVALAGVFLLDRERELVVGSASDTTGYYTITAPEAGEYYLYVQRIGYFENETPLFEAETGGAYGVDFEMRPEPFRIDPISVTVRNEELEDFLTLEFGVNPNTILGFRSYQGITVQEAKLKAEDNTDFLRELYIPVSHGRQVCVGSIYRGHAMRTTGSAGGERECGSLSVDGHDWPNEHIEEIDLNQIAVVVIFPGSVRLYTRQFDWTFRPGGGGR